MLNPPVRRSPRLIQRASILVALIASTTFAQDPPPAQWIRLDVLPGEMRLTPRESLDGVPPRFVVLTDGSVFVGGRREVLRGRLDKNEMQAISTRLDLAIKSVGRSGLPQTLVVGEGPALFRFSVLLGSPLQFVVMGNLEATGAPLSPLADLIRHLAAFRHPSLAPWTPAQFTMIVKERALPGGCRAASGLPPLAQTVANSVVVPEKLTHGFPTGSDLSQVCEGPKRFTVAFRPVIPGER